MAMECEFKFCDIVWVVFGHFVFVFQHSTDMIFSYQHHEVTLFNIISKLHILSVELM